MYPVQAQTARQSILSTSNDEHETIKMMPGAKMRIDESEMEIPKMNVKN